MEEIDGAESFDQVCRIIEMNPIPQFVMERKYYVTPRDRVCFIAKHHFPNDGPFNFLPIYTTGDGSCFAHALSHAVFGTQERHVEIRIRLIYEAVKNMDKYLDVNYLSLGTNNPQKHEIAKRYALYSGDRSVVSVRLTEANIRNIYKNDVMRICATYGYMGIWQFHQAAEITKTPIGSVFPKGTNKNIRRDFNKMILPENLSCHDKTPIYIMWSPILETDKPSNVKHFVTLLQKR